MRPGSTWEGFALVSFALGFMVEMDKHGPVHLYDPVLSRCRRAGGSK